MLNISNRQKLHKNYSLLLFIIILFASFVFINIGGGLLLSRWKADLTSDSRYTLSSASKQIISEIKSPLYIRVYLSAAISKDYPALYQYSQSVLRRLESYQNYNPQNISLEIRNPEPYSATAEEAQKLGLKSFLSADGQSKLYFGAALGNDNGDTHVIDQFLPSRAGHLESDISRAINTLNNPLRTKIGIITGGLPISEHIYGEGLQPEWAFLRILKNEYDIIKISPITSEIPYDIEALIVIPPRKISLILAYALDQYLLRGGRILLLTDPYSESKKQSVGRETDINNLLKNWGVSVDYSKVVGNTHLGKNFIDENTTGEIFYTNPLWLSLGKTEINAALPFTRDINSLNLQSSGHILQNNIETIKTVTLFSIDKNSGSINNEDLNLKEDKDLMQQFKQDNNTYILGLLLEGKADSSFAQNPLQGTNLDKDMLPFLATSIKDGKLLLLADTDLLTDTVWVDTNQSGQGNSYDIVSRSQNGEFILRAIDYLTETPNLPLLSSKQLSSNTLSILQKIYNKKLQPHKAQYEQNKKLLAEKEDINQMWNELIRSNEAALNMSIIKKLEQNRQEINSLQENIKRTDYQVRQETNKTTDILTWINVFAVPAILLLIIWVFNLLRLKKSQHKVREIINEYKIS